jgi:DDE superfamily endonuclease
MLGALGKPLWAVVDGAYAKASFLKPAKALGITVVSRLRKDAALFSVPDVRPSGRLGRPRIYGPDRIDLVCPQRGLPHGTSLLGGAFLIPRPLAEEPRFAKI